MSLATLIRGKRIPSGFATATPATFATPETKEVRTVASIATVAVANPLTTIPAPLVAVSVEDAATASLWLLHFIESDPLAVLFTPAVSHAGALACYPGAVAAEPQAARPQRTATWLETEEITALVQAVFAGDSEVDRNEALAVALADPDGALCCYRGISQDGGIDLPENEDDRRRCMQCLNLRGRVCSAARPGGLVSALRGYQPMRDTLQRCAGYQPNANDSDQRSGRERWPGLI